MISSTYKYVKNACSDKVGITVHAVKGSMLHFYVVFCLVLGFAVGFLFSYFDSPHHALACTNRNRKNDPNVFQCFNATFNQQDETLCCKIEDQSGDLFVFFAIVWANFKVGMFIVFFICTAFLEEKKKYKTLSGGSVFQKGHSDEVPTLSYCQAKARMGKQAAKIRRVSTLLRGSNKQLANIINNENLQTGFHCSGKGCCFAAPQPAPPPPDKKGRFAGLTAKFSSHSKLKHCYIVAECYHHKERLLFLCNSCYVNFETNKKRLHEELYKFPMLPGFKAWPSNQREPEKVLEQKDFIKCIQLEETIDQFWLALVGQYGYEKELKKSAFEPKKSEIVECVELSDIVKEFDRISTEDYFEDVSRDVFGVKNAVPNSPFMLTDKKKNSMSDFVQKYRIPKRVVLEHKDEIRIAVTLHDASLGAEAINQMYGAEEVKTDEKQIFFDYERFQVLIKALNNWDGEEVDTSKYKYSTEYTKKKGYYFEKYCY